MGLVVATTFGLVVWLVLWALGSKAVDSFMITLLVVIVAATARMLAPHLPGNRDS
jgi:Mn2+/Fe2+ NRAMP family transporter